MRILWRLVTLMVMLATAPLAAAGGDAAAGEQKSRPCHACHGPDGISINDLWPNLAGQKQGYLIKQIAAFRNGTRQDPVMPIFVKGLLDQDISDIAAYYSSLSGVALPRATLQ